MQGTFNKIPNFIKRNKKSFCSSRPLLPKKTSVSSKLFLFSWFTSSIFPSIYAFMSPEITAKINNKTLIHHSIFSYFVYYLLFYEFFLLVFSFLFFFI